MTEPLSTHTLSTCFMWESTSPTPSSAPFHGNSSLYFVDLIFLTLEYVGIPPIAICSYSSRFPEERARYSFVTKSESEVAQLCQTVSDPMDCSLRGSSIHGIFQARVLEWVAIAFSRMKQKLF